MAIQINFWVITFLILTTVIHFIALAMTMAYAVQIPFVFLPSLIMSVVGGIFYGVALGISDRWMEEHLLVSKSLGVTILAQGVTYFLVLVAMMALTRFVVWEYFILPYFFMGVSPIADESAWKYYAYVVLVYTFPMGLVISFINQMNKKFGPGVLIPLLLGKYRNPKEEERTFMFMDLESSTSHAENLGHIKYSAVIRDSFLDISRAPAKHQAEVYQYVGDEIVVSWPVKDKMDRTKCVDKLFNYLEWIRKVANKSIELEGILMTMHEPNTRVTNIITRELQAKYGKYIFETIIPKNTVLGEASFYGKPAILYKVKSRGSTAYLALAKEIIARHERVQTSLCLNLPHFTIANNECHSEEKGPTSVGL